MEPTLFSLQNKIAIVTGGYGYLGASICRGLSMFGAKVIAAGPNLNKFDLEFSELEKKYIFFCQLDVMDDNSIKNLFSKISEKFGSIDILINNAIAIRSTHPYNTNRDDLKYTYDGLIGSVTSCINHVIPYMDKNDGKIINISSMYGLVSPDFNIYDKFPNFFNSSQYGASKAAIIQLTKYYANFLASKNIRVNCISPGPFPAIEVQKHESFIHLLKHKVPLGRIGTAEELRGVIILLASNASSYITGQNFIIDGGWTIR